MPRILTINNHITSKILATFKDGCQPPQHKITNLQDLKMDHNFLTNA